MGERCQLSKINMKPVTTIILVVVCVLLGDLIITRGPSAAGRRCKPVTFSHHKTQAYRVLDEAWTSTAAGSVCNGTHQQQQQQSHPAPPPVCRLPSVWLNCTQGLYIDVGTNVGVQIRKLYDPWQFPGAAVLGLYDETYGTNRSSVCAIGIEANPAHTPYLTTLNQYFQRKGYQALVLTETAASTRTGSAVFHFDAGSPVQWGASLSKGGWQQPRNSSTNEGTVALVDLPAFLADIVRPLVAQVHQATGRKPPVGMKLDVEGEEYALLPAMITNGALCELDMIYAEVHPINMRSEAGAAANMTVEAIEDAFAHLRKANPRCSTRYTHLDDESYLRAHVEVPLPP